MKDAYLMVTNRGVITLITRHAGLYYSLINIILEKTRRFAACTQAVVILRSTSYIAIKLNVLHLKSYEIQLMESMSSSYSAFQVAFLGIDK